MRASANVYIDGFTYRPIRDRDACSDRVSDALADSNGQFTKAAGLVTSAAACTRVVKPCRAVARGG
jgi:hypothetical protein